MAAWAEKNEPPAPVILPGQFEIVVDEEGDTDLREVVIPPGKKKAPHPEQFALGLSEF